MKRSIKTIALLAAIGGLTVTALPAAAQTSPRPLLNLNISPGSSALDLNLGILNLNSRGQSLPDGTQFSQTDTDINLGPILRSQSSVASASRTSSSLLSGLLGGGF